MSEVVMSQSLAADVQQKLHVDNNNMSNSNMMMMSGEVQQHSSDFMDLYSRQIGAYGIELMGKLARLQVLVVGLGGIGVETAKNLILAGPKQCVLFDPKPTHVEDLGTNFYLKSSHVEEKISRAQACMPSLSTLNPYVDVSIHIGSLDSNFLKQFHVIAITLPLLFSELVRINEVCRENNIKFIFASTLGVSSTVFSDFGDAHVVSDVDGEPTRTNVVEHISDDGIITVSGDRHRLDDGDYVRFEELEYIPALNLTAKPFKITRIFASVKDSEGKERSVLVPNQFKIDVSSHNDNIAYTGGGLVSQVKVSQTLSFRALKISAIYPVLPDQFMGLPHMDMNKLLTHNRAAQLHMARLAIWRFQEQHDGELPQLHSQADADECVSLSKQILEEHKAIDDGEALLVDSIDTDVVTKVSLYARCELPGFCAFLGGVVAQEVLKAPGKYKPLGQWLHHDAFELTSDDGVRDDALVQSDDILSRYAHQIHIFGKAFQEKLLSQKWFMVGAGALGCEYLKGMALMGLGCGAQGRIHVTDMDRIEVSNLNRQFLFRRDNVGQAKSSCACAAAKVMNPDLQVHTYEVRVGPKTEDVFDDDFWMSLDGVWNALDNVIARRYTDSKCVLHDRPLLESGTLGTKANCETILPGETQSYSDQKEQEEDSIPMCTLRNFPHFPEHCIEWARAQFSDWFEDLPNEFNTLVRDSKTFFAHLDKERSTSVKLESLRRVANLLDIVHNASFEQAVSLAVKKFTQQFRNRINDLTHAFPREARKTDADSGADLGLFWSGEKRFPQSAQLTYENTLHADFIHSASCLFAFMLSVPINFSRQQVITSARTLAVPEWMPPQKMTVQIDDDKPIEDETCDQDQEELNALRRRLEHIDFSNINPLQVAEFEKDDDSNFHIDFITATSNLRSWNYRIKQQSRHKCKMIAGKIIPALATTTAMITGLVELELYKIVMGLKADKFANANVNLAVNSFQAFAPLEPAKAKAQYDIVMCEEIHPIPDGFTVWDKVRVDEGDLTVTEFLSAVARVHYEVQIQLLFKEGITDEMIAEGKGKSLYNANPYLPEASKAIQASYANRNLRELYEEIYGETLPSSRHYLVLEAATTDKERNSVLIPKILYFFKH